MALIKTIVYPYDFSKFSRAALPYVKELRKTGAERVIIVSVVEYEELFTHVLFKETEIRKLKESTEKRLEGIKKELEGAGFDVRIAVDFGMPSKVIIKTAASEKAGLIVMGSQGRGAVMNALLGSTAENVLKRSDIPVLIVPPRNA